MLVAMTSLDVAFVAAIAGVVGASGGILSAIAVLWLAPKSMRQQKELARSERLHAELRSSYADYLYNMYALNDAVRETQPRRPKKCRAARPRVLKRSFSLRRSSRGVEPGRESR